MLIWAPRSVAFPLYLVSEFALRRPLGALTVTAEREHWPTAILDFFSFDRSRKAGILPTAFVDFGFRPSAGLYFFWDDAFVKGNAIRVHGGTWGPEWLSGAVTDRYELGDNASIGLRVEAVRRSDYVFHGVGPRTLETNRSRYASDKLEVAVQAEALAFGALSLRSAIGARRVSFREGTCCNSPSIFERIQAGELAVLDGLGGYHLAFSRLELALDSRFGRAPGASASGVRIEVQGEPSFDLEAPRPTSFVRYGGTLGASVDLTGTRRVLSLSVSALFADRVTGDPIPFPELVKLGGFELMRGYREGRLADRSAGVATLAYEWPIWVWISGSLQAAVGNVFGEHLSDFDPKLLRLSTTVGIRTVGSPDHRFEILTGFGTETWEEGLRLTSFRLLVGGTRGF